MEKMSKIFNFIKENALVLMLFCSIIIGAAYMYAFTDISTQMYDALMANNILAESGSGKIYEIELEETEPLVEETTKTETEESEAAVGDEPKVEVEETEPETVAEDTTSENVQELPAIDNVTPVSDLPVVATPNFIAYEPIEVDSRYYTDVGRIPLSMNANYKTVSKDFFSDACFIGDSRGVGICDYSGWENADFFCDNGFCAYDYAKGRTVKRQGTREKYTVEQIMDRRQYNLIYIMIGTNDLGYGNTEMFKNEYSDMVNMIRQKQPNAVLYLVGNLHISNSAEINGNHAVMTNRNLNAKNAAIADCADGKKIFYIDFNEIFVDENGYLTPNRTFDGYHLYAEGYIAAVNYIESHVVDRTGR